MITYEYKCNTCGNEFEKQSTISKYKGQEKCPLCQNISKRHHRTPAGIDTYFSGSTKDQHPVPGI